MRRTLTIAAAAGSLAAFGLGLSALAQPAPPAPPPGPHGHGPGHVHAMLHHMAIELELTDEQIGAIRSLVHERMSGTLHESMRALHEARVQLGRVVHDIDAGDAQVVEAARAVAASEERIALEQHRLFLDVTGELTDEQRARARELMAESPFPHGPRGPHGLHGRHAPPGPLAPHAPPAPGGQSG